MDRFSKLKNHLDTLILTAVLLVLIVSNYSPNTWLVGWDNLMPELNIGMNIKRSLFAVWQQYQGLGLVGGMGHATDLIRQLVLLPFVAILPNSLIRYLWHFAMITLGTFGVFLGLKNYFKVNRFVALVSALFYLLNFGSVQNFWAPFEPFSTFWGFFPWLMYSWWQTLESPDSKKIFRFFLLNLFAIPSFYVQTIFIVYLFCIFITLLSFLVFHFKKKLFFFSLSSKLLTILFCLNAFWLLPFVYFIKHDIHNPQSGIGNTMASMETFQRNQNRGHISDFLLLRGYYYDFPDNGTTLMSSWSQHFSDPMILISGYLLALIIIIGLVSLIYNFKKINAFKLALLGIFLLSCIALLTATFPFAQVNGLLRQIPVLNQVFRSPFTKFITPSVFAFSLLFAIGLQSILNTVSRINLKPRLFYPLICITTSALILIFSYPAFFGNYFYPHIRQQIPSEYFQLFDFFKTQPKSARIANLPSGNFWGWTNYRFGIRGSGFLWYAIEQPILDRAFDVWNLKNEQYYWELDHVLQKNNPAELSNLMAKYSINFIVFDDNVYFPDEKIYSKMALGTKNLLDSNPDLKLVKKFNQLSVYELVNKTSPYLVTNPVNISQSEFFYYDSAFNTYGDYVSSSNTQASYPFANLFTSRNAAENPFDISLENGFINISTKDSYGQTKILKSIYQNIPSTPPVSTKASSQTDLLLKDFSVLRTCSQPASQKAYDPKAYGTDMVLQISTLDKAVCTDCIKSPSFFKNIKNTSVIEFSFEYKSNADEWPQFCFWNGSRCLNNKDTPVSGFSSDWKLVKERFVFDPKSDRQTILTFLLDANQQKERKFIYYRKPKISIYQLPNSYRLTQEVPSRVYADNGKIAARIPATGNQLTVKNPIQSRLFTLDPATQSLLSENGNQFIRLKSNSNNNLSTWSFSQLPLNYSYLAKIVYRHVSNYPLTLSAFSNNGEHFYFHTKLNSNNNWQTDWYLIPKLENNAGDNGITLLFNNQSFNRKFSTNDINSIEIYPVPFENIRNLTIPENAAFSKSQKRPVASSQSIFVSKVNVPTVNSDTYLFHPQSYHQGWYAFKFDGLIPRPVGRHVLANNWANAWQLSAIGNRSSTIYIVFIPQILEFLGIALLATISIGMIKKSRSV